MKLTKELLKHLIKEQVGIATAEDGDTVLTPEQAEKIRARNKAGFDQRAKEQANAEKDYAKLLHAAKDEEERGYIADAFKNEWGEKSWQKVLAIAKSMRTGTIASSQKRTLEVVQQEYQEAVHNYRKARALALQLHDEMANYA